jgi:hypothetical protein
LHEDYVMATQATQQGDPRAEAREEYRRRKLKDAINMLTNERDTANKRVEGLTKELESLKAKTDNSALAKQNQELRQQLRTIEHRKVFDRLAMEQGADPRALDDLFTASGWKADSDTFDETEMTAAITGQRDQRPYLFGGGKQDQLEAKPIIKPAAGTGQGPAERAKKEVTDAALIPFDDPRRNDAAWVMKNRDLLILSANERIRRGEV